MPRSLLIVLLAVGLALGGAAATACSSSSEEAAPSRPPVPPVTTDPDAAVVPDGGGDSDAGCRGPNACFACEPVALDEFLNACTDGQCTPFDNVKRLPLYKAGQALPPVP